MTHLLIVVPAYAPFVGGAQTFCRAMARRLVADGHRVTVLTTNAQQVDDFWSPPPAIRVNLPPRDEMDGAQIIRLALAYPWPAPWHFGILRRATHFFARLPLPAVWKEAILRHFAPSLPPLFGLQSELPPAVAHADLVLLVDASWDGLFVAAAQAAFAQGKPVVVVPLIHTGSPAITGRFRMAHQIAVYQRAAAVIALSQPEKATLAEWGVAQARLHTLAMGVDVAVDTDAIRQNREAVRQRYELPDRFVLFLGAATYDKGAFTLAQAVAELAREGEIVEIVCAGSQQHQLAVFLDIFPPDTRAILKERIHLLGSVDEETKQVLLSECVVLALPSRVDSFGIVLLEAWQHAKPVVAAAVGGPATLVTHEKTGLLVPFDDSAALASALQRLLKEPGLAARLGASGRQTVINQYRWDNCYDAFSRIAADACRPTPGTADERL